MLDTHTFIWAATLDERLSSKAKELLLDSDNELFLSTVSIWEMAIKTSLGKLILQQPLEQTINEQIQINGLRVVNIEASHALAAASLPWHHRDPFDRLLICQSELEKLTILGRDHAMDAYGIERLW
ncbi:MAG: type II toxin-antitoxin system VapC family toxin [Mariprofundaceae bacterium]|nr:type II toxin-antitoxin system VapC family toxin [Mariprofundaceae bacterium]